MVADTRIARLVGEAWLAEREPRYVDAVGRKYRGGDSGCDCDGVGLHHLYIYLAPRARRHMCECNLNPCDDRGPPLLTMMLTARLE